MHKSAAISANSLGPCGWRVSKLVCVLGLSPASQKTCFNDDRRALMSVYMELRMGSSSLLFICLFLILLMLVICNFSKHIFCN